MPDLSAPLHGFRHGAEPAELRRRGCRGGADRGPCASDAGASRRRQRTPSSARACTSSARTSSAWARSSSAARSMRSRASTTRSGAAGVVAFSSGNHAQAISLVGDAARHAGGDRHAARRAGRQGGGDEGLRWQRRRLRPLSRGPRGDRQAARRGTRHDARSALRPPRRHRRAGHCGEGAVRRGRRARCAVRVPRRRRPALGLGARGARALACLQGLRRRARGGQRRTAVVSGRPDRFDRDAAHHRRRRADAAPRRAHVPDHPARRDGHLHRDRRRARRRDALLRRANEDGRRADGRPRVCRGKADAARSSQGSASA